MNKTHNSSLGLVSVLIIAGLLAAGQFAKISVFIDELATVYPERGASIGLLISAISVVGMISGLFFGGFLTRVGFRTPLIGALLLGGALSWVQSYSLHFSVFAVSRMIEGISHLIIVVAAPTLIGHITVSRARTLALTLWSTVFAASFAIFTWVGVPVAQNLGVSFVFQLHGALMVLIAIFIWKLLPAGIVPRVQGPLTLKEVIGQHAMTYSSPYICAPAVGWFFYAMGFVAIVTAAPLYFGAETSVLIRGVLPLSALIVSLTLGVFLIKWVSPIKLIVIGFGLAATIPLALLAQASIELASILTLSVLGLVQVGSFNAIPVLNAGVREQALANGAVAQMGNAGNVIGTPALLMLMGMFGLNGLIVFSGVVFGLGALTHLALASRRTSS